MAELIGIDLGTTMSAVARVNAAGTPEIVLNEDGSNLTPSAVEVTGPDPSSWVVGAEAKKVLFDAETPAFRAFKRDMGTEETYATPYCEADPVSLSSAVLRSLLSNPDIKGKAVASAVVTIPANFGHAKRAATMNAAKQAGLDIQYIPNEPTAAALYFSHQQPRHFQGTVAVFDLGGGTFDVTLLRLEGREANILATDGIERLGGIDFDEAMAGLVRAKYAQKTGQACEEADYDLNRAEEDKKSLSKRESKKIKVRGGAGAENLTVTRQELERCIAPQLKEMRDLCARVLQQAKLSPKSLDVVVLAGGSVRMPCVQEAARSAFKKEPTLFENPDEIVALGAALFATHRSKEEGLTPQQASAVDGVNITERSSRCFGTFACRQGTNGTEHYNSMVIPRGETLPCKVTKEYHTITSNQKTVSCEVTESSHPETDIAKVEVIWEDKLHLQQGRPKGHKIFVEFAYDENQVMTCSFRDGRDGKVQGIQFQMTGEGATPTSASSQQGAPNRGSPRGTQGQIPKPPPIPPKPPPKGPKGKKPDSGPDIDDFLL